MDRLHVATLNILNLADRWLERLPLLLADMAALQPDLLGLQEVVYVMQQDRLIGAAGEGRVRRGPRLGRPAGVRQQPARPGAAGGDRRRPARPRPQPSAHRALVALPGGASVLSSSPTSITSGPTRRCATSRRRRILAWLAGAPAADATVVVGDFNADPAEPTYAGCAAPGSAPPTRGERRRARGHLAVRAAGAGDGHRRRPRLPRLHLGPRRRPGRRRAARLRPPGSRRRRRSTRATTSGSPPSSRSGSGSDGRADAPARPSRRLAPRPGEHARGVRGRARRPGCDGLEFDVRRSADGVPVVFHDATLGARPGPAGARRRADGRRRSRRSACRPWPTSSRRSAAGRSSTSSSRAIPDRPSSRCWRLARRRACARGRVVVRAGRRSSASAARPGLAALAQQPTRSTPTVIAAALALGCRGVAVEWRALDRRGAWRRPGRPASRSPRGPSGAARPSTGWRASGSWPSASRRRRSTADGRRRATGACARPGSVSVEARDGGHRMVDRADLVVVGAGTVGGWASVFARATGLGRVVVVERGLAGMGASSRAAGIVRAQGGTPATVALGRWTIDFYNGQQAAYGTDSGFRELGYLILAVTDEDERAGRERVAMQQAEGLDVTLARRRGGRRDRRSPSPRAAIGAAATSRPTARSTRRATSAPIRSRCRRPASSCASGRRSRASGRSRPPDGGTPGRRRRDRRGASSRPSGSC